MKEDANPPYLSKLGYYYADYLLQQDPQKNHALAFQLYEVTSKYSGKAALHYANALLKYQTGQEEAALKQVINAFEYHKYDRSLNEKSFTMHMPSYLITVCIIQKPKNWLSPLH